jgi:hypothetical protein
VVRWKWETGDLARFDDLRGDAWRYTFNVVEEQNFSDLVDIKRIDERPIMIYMYTRLYQEILVGCIMLPDGRVRGTYLKNLVKL